MRNYTAVRGQTTWPDLAERGQTWPDVIKHAVDDISSVSEQNPALL